MLAFTLNIGKNDYAKITKQRSSMNKRLITALSGNLSENKSIPFWSWNNELDESELVKQINDMHSAGIGGFIMHARLGFSGEYLGEKWFSCVKACLNRARELDMEAWVYDENGWPSGFVGGKLLQNEAFRARYLELVKGEFSNSAFAVFIADEKLGFTRVSAPVGGYSGEYYNIYLRVSPSNTDILNPEVVDAFIAETHEKYYARFSQSFGRELRGFFTDEPQYYRAGTPYTPCAQSVFAKNGEDIKDGLIWLFVHDERGYEFRTKYFGTLNELYVNNFYKKLYDWCNAHNCKLTGHSIEENSLYAQMWGGASVTPTYEYEHIPAIDCLGRYDSAWLSAKQVGSCAAQLGKKLVLSETFACSGHDVTPEELKSIAEIQYFNGVSKTCQHLYPYSLAGQGKIDHPPVFSPQANWFEGFKQFNDYFTRLGYIISNTQELCDVAIISPMRDIWLDYVKAEELESVKQTEFSFDELVSDLRRSGVTYQLIDERVLERHGSFDGDKLRVGEMLYDKIIVPKMRTIAPKTLELLQGFGGKLCVLSKLTYASGTLAKIELNSNCKLSDIKACARVKFSTESENCFITERKSDLLGDFIFVKNASQTKSAALRFSGVAQNYVALDLQTLKTRKISNDITLERCGSLILVKDESAAPASISAPFVENVTGNFCVEKISENFFVSDYASFSFNGTDFGEIMPIPQLFETLLRKNYKGRLFVKHEFYLKEAMPLSLTMEKLKLLSASVNGEPISFKPSDFDVNFVIADISHAARAGKNSFVYEVDYYQHDGVYYALFAPNVTESLRNCLYYDTHIENVYLKGDFIVNPDFSLQKRTKMPPVSSENRKNGYPFFKGELVLKGDYDYSGEGERVLSLSGRFVMAKLSCGGKQKLMVLGTKTDITPLLKKGKNQMRITLYSSLRNLFGPHHYVVEEPIGVSPPAFTMRGSWGNGTAADYVHEYHCMPFGVDKIEIISEK